MCHGNCVNSGSRIRRSQVQGDQGSHRGGPWVREQGHGALTGLGGEGCKYSQFIAAQTENALNCNDFDSQNPQKKKGFLSIVLHAEKWFRN